MSPIRAQGINMALRDAVVAANHLVPACAAIAKDRERKIIPVQKLQLREVRGQRWAREKPWLMAPLLKLPPAIGRLPGIKKMFLWQRKPRGAVGYADSMSSRRRIANVMCLVLAASLSIGVAGSAFAQHFKAYEESSPVNTIIAIDPESWIGSIPDVHATCNFDPPNTLFGTGFATGWSDVDGTLYILDAGSVPNVLETLTINSAGCGIAAEVSPVNTTGFGDLESLAYCPVLPGAVNYLYSQSFDFGAHTGVMVRIDLATGIGEQVGGTMAADLRITGMDCDAGGLWAITHAHTSRASELYRIDPTSGVATLIGATGISGGVVQSLSIDRTAPSLRLVAGSSSLYDINPGTGEATLITGGFGTLWAMTSMVPEPTPGVLGMAALSALALLERRRSPRRIGRSSG